MRTALRILLVIIFLSIALLIWQIGSVRSDIEDRTALVLSAARNQPEAPTSSLDLEALPAPVRRYLRKALKPDGQRIQSVLLKQEGELETAPDQPGYKSFEATHSATVGKPGFLWNATIDIFPGIRVVDSYVNQSASGTVYLMSLIPLDSRSDQEKLNQGALYRYLAESVWYPQALLPGNGVRWTALDESRALATLEDGPNSVSLEFRFNQEGLVESIYAEDRYGLFGEEFRRLPWEGRFSNYREVDGMLIPMKGEVGWHMPDGFWLFWKGSIKEVRFTYR